MKPLKELERESASTTIVKQRSSSKNFTRLRPPTFHPLSRAFGRSTLSTTNQRKSRLTAKTFTSYPRSQKATSIRRTTENRAKEITCSSRHSQYLFVQDLIECAVDPNKLRSDCFDADTANHNSKQLSKQSKCCSMAIPLRGQDERRCSHIVLSPDKYPITYNSSWYTKAKLSHFRR